MSTDTKKTARDHAVDLKAAGMQCNCDLDNWEPERSTGHSCVCRINGGPAAFPPDLYR